MPGVQHIPVVQLGITWVDRQWEQTVGIIIQDLEEVVVLDTATQDLEQATKAFRPDLEEVAALWADLVEEVIL